MLQLKCFIFILFFNFLGYISHDQYELYIQYLGSKSQDFEGLCKKLNQYGSERTISQWQKVSNILVDRY